MAKSSGAALCPCGSTRAYTTCCGRFHAGAPASDAAELMRSRYSAYVRELEPYLMATWHPDTRPTEVAFDSTPPPQWLGLTVRAHDVQDADHATVEFVARYKLNGRAFKLHEVSRFQRVAGAWLYVDGELQA